MYLSFLYVFSRAGSYHVVLGDYDRGSIDGDEQMIKVANIHLVSMFVLVFRCIQRLLQSRLYPEVFFFFFFFFFFFRENC